MTVSYTADVVNASSFGCFLKLLARWRGSVYKLIWKDLIMFLAFYYALNCTYRYCLNAKQQKHYERIVAFCQHYNSLIPLCFVLGFYASVVIYRWWEQYSSVPGITSIAIFVNTHLHGQDERSRIMRRTIMRYVCVSLTIVLTMISPRVKKRFPTLQHLVAAGMLEPIEHRVLEDVKRVFPKYSLHWLPITWAANLVTHARREGRIHDDHTMHSFINYFNNFRMQCVTLLNYDAISVPLVYTQVVALTLYSYFGCQLLALQWTNQPSHNIIDMHFPFFGVLEFCFFVGWLKVAETMLNPFGDDDDDFEVNFMVDNNLRSSYLIVDKISMAHPKLMRDSHWSEVLPQEMPYRKGARRDTVPECSTANVEIPKQTYFTVPLENT